MKKISYYDDATHRIIYDDKSWSLKTDLEYTGAYSGNRPYLRRPTKIQLYREIKEDYPNGYEYLKSLDWFSAYEKEIDYVIPKVLLNDKLVLDNNNNNNNKSEEEDNMNIVNAINNLTNKINNMNTNTKLEQALIEGIVEKGKELAVDDLKQNLMKELDKFIKEQYGVLPQKINIIKKDIEYDKTGLFHKDFEKVLKLVNLKIPVMLTGGAGAGKNYMLEQVANALNLSFYYTSTITQEYKLTGFIDGGGKYHETEFFKAFTQGGVFMLDEIDASIPECLVILNGAIANGYFDFPTGREFAHEDFRVVCAGNTVGLGADLVYTGRNVIDGATLDRFVLVEIDYDKRIEENLCQDEELRKFLYDVRKSITMNKINHIIGLRCFKYSYELLINGFDKSFIIKSVIFKGLGKDDIIIIKNALGGTDNDWFKSIDI